MTAQPVHLQADPMAASVFMIVGVIFFAISLLWAIRESSRTRMVLPLLALIGGFIASLEEAWIDVLIQLWYPVNSPQIMFTALGVPQPLYVHLVYPGFVGLGSYITYRCLLGNASNRMLWRIFFGIVVMDLLFEQLGTAAGAYYYYGQQPFQLFHNGWPAWVAPINAAGPMLGGWLIYRLEPRLTGASRLLLALMPPMAYAGMYGAAGWPTATMLNSDVPVAIVWLAACLSMFLATLVVPFIQASRH